MASNNNTIKYSIQLGLDKQSAQEVKTAIQNLEKEIDKIEEKGKKNNDTSLIKKANEKRKELEQLNKIVNGAWNEKLDRADPYKLNDGLRQLYGNMNNFQRSMASAGVDGQKIFGNLSSSILGANTQMTQSSKILNKIAESFGKTLGWGITSSVVNRFSRAIQGAWGYVQHLDKSLNDIRIVSGESAANMEKFAKQANAAAKTLGTSTLDYTDAALIYYQQGLDEKQVAERTETTLKMANVIGVDAATVSSYMTGIWNNFDDGTKSLEYFGDALVALGASTAASSSEIAEGLTKFAAIADTVGLSYEYATSALATVVATTRQSAEVVGTAFKTIFARMEDLKLGETIEDGTDIGKYAQGLAAVGISIKDSSGQLKDMDTLLDEMGAKWQTLSRDQQVALTQVVAGIRQYSQLVALMDNWDTMKDNIQTAANATGALQQQQETYMESMQAHFQGLSTEWQRTYDIIFNPDTMNETVDVVTKLLEKFNDFIEGIGGGSKAIIYFASLFTNLLSRQVGEGLQRIVSNIEIIRKNENILKSHADYIKMGNSASEKNLLIQEIRKENAIRDVIIPESSSRFKKILEEEMEDYKKILKIEHLLTEEQQQQLKDGAVRVADLKRQLEIEKKRKEPAEGRIKEFEDNASDQLVSRIGILINRTKESYLEDTALAYQELNNQIEEYIKLKQKEEEANNKYKTTQSEKQNEKDDLDRKITSLNGKIKTRDKWINNENNDDYKKAKEALEFAKKAKEAFNINSKETSSRDYRTKKEEQKLEELEKEANKAEEKVAQLDKKYKISEGKQDKEQFENQKRDLEAQRQNIKNEEESLKKAYQDAKKESEKYAKSGDFSFLNRYSLEDLEKIKQYVKDKGETDTVLAEKIDGQIKKLKEQGDGFISNAEKAKRYAQGVRIASSAVQGLATIIGTTQRLLEINDEDLSKQEKHLQRYQAVLSGITGLLSTGAFALGTIASGGNTMVGMAASTLASSLSTLFGSFLTRSSKKAVEEVKKAAEQAAKDLEKSRKEIEDQQSLQDTYSKNDIAQEWKVLVAGVDEYGNNISLTNEEYNKYLQYCKEMAEVDDSLIDGYNREGQAIITSKNAIEQMNEALKEQIRLTQKTSLTGTQYSARLTEIKDSQKEGKNQLDIIRKDYTKKYLSPIVMAMSEYNTAGLGDTAPTLQKFLENAGNSIFDKNTTTSVSENLRELKNLKEEVKNSTLIDEKDAKTTLAFIERAEEGLKQYAKQIEDAREKARGLKEIQDLAFEKAIYVDEESSAIYEHLSNRAASLVKDFASGLDISGQNYNNREEAIEKHQKLISDYINFLGTADEETLQLIEDITSLNFDSEDEYNKALEKLLSTEGIKGKYIIKSLGIRFRDENNEVINNLEELQNKIKKVYSQTNGSINTDFISNLKPSELKEFNDYLQRMRRVVK